MMTGFISPKARIEGFIEDYALILGPSVIGLGTLIGEGVIVGYPVEKTLKALILSHPFDITKYDTYSKGAEIGQSCIIRSGTVIYETTKIGNKVRTGHNVLIREDSVIGDETLIGSSTKLDGAVRIGKRVKIQSNAYLPHLTIVEDDVFIAPNVCFTNDLYPQSNRLVGVVIERNAIICANATIIAGVRIGEKAVVGAGSVVTKNVPLNTVVLGNPAHRHMTRKEFDEKKESWDKELKK